MCIYNAIVNMYAHKEVPRNQIIAKERHKYEAFPQLKIQNFNWNYDIVKTLYLAKINQYDSKKYIVWQGNKKLTTLISGGPKVATAAGTQGSSSDYNYKYTQIK